MALRFTALLALTPVAFFTVLHVADAQSHEPPIAAELERRASERYDSYAAGEWGAVWDRLDAAGQQIIDREDYVRRMDACDVDLSSVPIVVQGVHERTDGTWIVWVSVAGYTMEVPAAYEDGRWVFPFTPSEALTMRYGAATFVANCR